MNVGKYLLYVVIAFVIAFVANFFGVIHVPWLDVPFATEKGYYTHDADRSHGAAQEIEEKAKP